ncbi:MAG: dihydroorotase [Chitinophagales bacterium]|nr:dihydroorotase [Chitinophagales bacterium]
MRDTIIKNAKIVNENKIIEGDLYIKGDRIEKVGGTIDLQSNTTEINANGNLLIPGIIDDQVHFREPGLTHKAEIYTEAKSGITGGVTTFMEMPNTKPPALNQELLQDKYDIAEKRSLANYSFFMGASNENIEEVLKTDPQNVCGLKVFMGSSTGNMLVDDETVLDNIFSKVPMLIATHCEDEATVRKRTSEYLDRYGEGMDFSKHPEIRNEEACYKSSSLAVSLAKKYGTRLHILHISTEEELALFEKGPVENKKITSEVCVHHLYFDADDYSRYGSKIKCNPAIKDKRHKKALLAALLDDKLDIIATDHAPHTIEEKSQSYFKAPSGVPLLQHSLNIMLDFYHRGEISLEKLVDKMCHAPAKCFQVSERGYLREGYFADVVIVDPETELEVSRNNIYYKCGWSPFEGQKFKGKATHTFVNGHLVYNGGQFDESRKGMRVKFNR